MKALFTRCYRAIISTLLTGIWASIVKLRRTSRKDSKNSDSPGDESTAWLLDGLRRWPWWRRGHLDLARTMLTQGDLHGAYASACAVQKLSRSREQRQEALYLLATIFLRQGMYEDAREILEALHAAFPSRYSIAEDYAAALIGLGDTSKAFECLNQIPAEKLSGEGHAALKYVAGKSDEKTR